MERTIHIKGGPSREELFDGLRLVKEKRWVEFTIQGPSDQFYLRTQIYDLGVGENTISSDVWKIKLLVRVQDLPIFGLWYEIRQEFKKSKTVLLCGKYSTKTRTGCIFEIQEK